MNPCRDVYVIASARTPFCRSYTGYQDLSNLDLLSVALNGLVAKTGLAGDSVGEVTAGAVVVHSADWNLAREAVLNTALSPSTPATTLQMACGTSLQGALMLAAKIATGEIDSGIAGGSDTISDAPLTTSRKLAKRLVGLSKAKTFGAKLGAFKGLSLGELAPIAPSTGEPRTGLSMGQHCERMAKHWAIERTDQDALAAQSHINAAAAYQRGFFDDLLVPCNGVLRDNNLRSDTTAAGLAKLRPAFDRKNGTLTAGNSTALTDGAGAVLLGTREWAEARGLPLLAKLTLGQTAANNFAGGDGLLMAPTQAVAKLLERASLSLQDFDFYEIHEAFAAQVLCTLKAWEDGDGVPVLGAIDRSRLNVVGSSLAMGHPFAATGARVLGTAAKLVADQGTGRALISVCTAGGMGVAAIVEAVA
ncbi:acetyl-CoA C-acetyltransferase [Litorivicinus lipolyticus]|uniref:Acetyl-CoA C-acetyltransferase n=1 Tax=Litorivicinus lipolyticus TaxID=418701 RepID=A0A5Q2QEI1_9GAMM|nr:acetyl-CoA C-acetyltransferase [Litorivicinus lipolyticus]QGG80270.1 acetyl-CoA C-acetyltransferase [Litorivicinus lipolyticus]